MYLPSTILFLSFLSTYTQPAAGCMGGHDIGHVQVQASPAKNPPKQPAWKKIALVNVRVFDGTFIQPPSTVIIDGARIGLAGNFTVDETVDCKGDILIPGLIDSHAHPANLTHLQQLVSYGVTTVMAMGCAPEPNCNTLRGQTGLADLYSPGVPATSPNSTHAKMGFAQAGQLISTPADASWFVSNRVGNGSDYIKLIAEGDGMTQAEHNTLVSTSHAAGMQVMTHTSVRTDYQQAIDSGTDNIQHIPSDASLTQSMITAMLEKHIISTPTLSISQFFVDVAHEPGWKLSTAQANAKALNSAGVPVLAGTDASPGTLGSDVYFGTSLHGELELLNQAGLPTLDVLRAGTKRPAHAFGLWDRGVIKPGYRADLVLIKGDPLANISNTRNIQRVWAAGIEYKNVAKARKI